MQDEPRSRLKPMLWGGFFILLGGGLLFQRFLGLDMAEWWDMWPLIFSGRFPKNEPLPPGAYTFRYRVWDLAGNPGGTKSITVHVSDKILVETRGTVVVPPAAITTTRPRVPFRGSSSSPRARRSPSCWCSSSSASVPGRSR